MKLFLISLSCYFLCNLKAQVASKSCKLYLGLSSTPIKISDSIKALGILKISVKGKALLIKTVTNYELAPDTTARYGDTILVSISALKKGNYKIIEKRRYIVSGVPKPNPQIGYLHYNDLGGSPPPKNIYTKSQIIKADSIRVNLYDLDHPITKNFKIISYNIQYTINKKDLISIKVNGNKLKELIKNINLINSESFILIDNIRLYNTETKTSAALTPLFFYIK